MINSFGWRDKERTLEKSNNTYRIAVLGDSYVEAFQVESDSTFLTLTERQLNKHPGIKVELLNFGRSGYTQSEEFLILQNNVMQFSPDMVLLFFVPGNDMRDVSRKTASSLLRPFYRISKIGELIIDTRFVEMSEFKLKSFINWFKQNSALISLVSERYNAYKKQKNIKNKNVISTQDKETIKKKLHGFLSLCTANPDKVYLKNFSLNKMLIKAISEYCSEKRIRFMLVTVDINSYNPEIEKKYKLIDSTFNTNFFEVDLRDFAKLNNNEYLGLQGIFSQSFENNGIDLHWKKGHWNYKGHKLVAFALTEKLKSIISANE